MKTRPLVSARELADMLAAQDVLVVDCSFDLADPARGAREHALGHLPGAVFADLDRDLADIGKKGLGRHPLPDAAGFSQVLSRWGWSKQLRVVAYDNAGGALAAARLWWMLRLVGAADVAVLDGGIKAWTAAGFALTDAAITREPTQVAAQFSSAQIVQTDQLQKIRHECLLVDARANLRYRGENETIDPVAGHVPGAVNRPFATNLRADGSFKGAAELRTEFDELLSGTSPENVVHMCGSGVTACHNLLAMEYAGLFGSRVYAPSWSGWITNAHNPVATGGG